MNDFGHRKRERALVFGMNVASPVLLLRNSVTGKSGCRSVSQADGAVESVMSAPA